MRVFRILQETGTALWLGGQLFGAFALSRGVATLPKRKDRARVLRAAWSAWSPLALAGVGATALGSMAELRCEVGPARRHAKVRFGSAVGALGLTVLSGAVRSVVRELELRDRPEIRDEAGLPVAYLPARRVLEKVNLPLYVLQAAAALGMVLTA
jgi:hypothetical protein